MSYSVTQNTAFLTGASILQKIISFAYFTIIARLVGVASTGEYFFALSFVAIFIVVADFGLGPVLTREAAKHPEETEKYVATVFWTKYALTLGTYGLMFLAINLLGYPDHTRHLVYLAGVTMLFDSLQNIFYGVFRARKNLMYESIGVVGAQAITLIIGAIALWKHAPLYWLIIAYTIPSLLNLLFAAFAVKKVLKLEYKVLFDVPTIKLFIGLALPFALSGIIGRLYSYADSILISKFLGAEHIGWWSVPYKITFAFQFIPAALAASVFPVMSIFSASDTSKIGPLFERAWTYLLMIALPISFGLIAIAEPVILRLYGVEYAPSIPVLRILLTSLVFGYLSFITASALNATNHQKKQTTLLGLALTSNIIINSLLITRIGIVGAAVAALVGNIILCCGGLYFCRTIFTIRSGVILQAFWRVLWPATFMGLLVFYITQRVNFIVAIPCGVVLYGILLFASGALNRTMLQEFMIKIRHNKATPL